jgi:hypothetical protein
MNKHTENYVSGILTGFCLFVIAIIFLGSCTPGGTALSNLYVGQIKQIDNRTNYETKKKVEDTCRALIVSYKSDESMYLQYKDSEKAEEQSWAASAKIRANKTAFQYNEYILKNNYVWDGNVPADIRDELPILE